MKGKIGIAIAVGALASAAASTAHAQVATEEGRPYIQRRIPAPSMSTELGVSVGYTQGFGDVQRGQRIGNVADAGLGVGLNLGYRASPFFSIGWSGQYQEFQPDIALTRGTSVRGVATGFEAGFHTMPFQRIDPFLTAGAGYRVMWIAPAGPNNNVMIHGFELAKLQAGIDLRLSRDVAIAPVIGADLNLFVWRNPEGPVGNLEIGDKRVNTFLFAGALGRFDLGGTREVPVPVAVTTVGER
jgi:hypothetical protein